MAIGGSAITAMNSTNDYKTEAGRSKVLTMIMQSKGTAQEKSSVISTLLELGKVPFKNGQFFKKVLAIEHDSQMHPAIASGTYSYKVRMADGRLLFEIRDHYLVSVKHIAPGQSSKVLASQSNKQ